MKLLAGLFATGTILVAAGIIVGEVTRKMILFYFNYANLDHLIWIETLPFFVIGGMLIVGSIGTIVLHGDN